MPLLFAYCWSRWGAGYQGIWMIPFIPLHSLPPALHLPKSVQFTPWISVFLQLQCWTHCYVGYFQHVYLGIAFLNMHVCLGLPVYPASSSQQSFYTNYSVDSKKQRNNASSAGAATCLDPLCYPVSFCWYCMKCIAAYIGREFQGHLPDQFIPFGTLPARLLYLK